MLRVREALGMIQAAEEAAALRRERNWREEQERIERERADEFRKQLALLLTMFDNLTGETNAQRRGYLLEDLLNRTFDLHGIAVVESFRRNAGAEQIDGAFRFNEKDYLVECRWQKEPSDVRDTDSLLGKILRSGKGAMGLFLSINGWSTHVVPTLKQNPEKSIILMDGYDLRTALAGQVDLRELLAAKARALILKAEPHLGASQALSR